MITDIYNIIQTSDNTYTINKFTNIIFYDMIKMNNYCSKIYVYYNKYLIISENIRNAYLIENIDNKFKYDNRYFINRSKVTKITLEEIPLIDQYHDIINQEIELYYDPINQMNVLFVNELQENTKIMTSFIRLEGNIPEYKINNLIRDIIKFD